jgi:hypothetical protein
MKMKRFPKIMVSTMTIAVVALFALCGNAHAGGAQNLGDTGNGNTLGDPVDPAYTRLNDDPADGGQGAFQQPAADPIPLQEQVQVARPQ